VPSFVTRFATVPLTGLVLLAFAASAHADQYVYVANAGSGDVSQYSVGAGGAVTALSPARVGAGDTPSDVVVSPDRKSVYVTNSGDDTVSQYDVGADGTLSPKDPPTVSVGVEPQRLAPSPNGQTLYVTNRGLGSPYSGAVFAYAVEPDGSLSGLVGSAPTGVEPNQVVVSPDGGTVYVANEFSAAGGHPGTVSHFYSDSLQAKSPSILEPGAGWLQSLALTPDGRSAYGPVVQEHGIGALHHYTANGDGTLSLAGSASVGSSEPYDVAVSPDGYSLYVAVSPPFRPDPPPVGNLLQYDVDAAGNPTPKTPLLVGGSGDTVARAVIVNPDGRSVYATSADGLSQYDVNVDGALSPKDPVTVAAGEDPLGVAASPLHGVASVRAVGSRVVVRGAPGVKDNLVITRGFGLRVTDLPNGQYTGAAIYAGFNKRDPTTNHPTFRCGSEGAFSATCNDTVKPLRDALNRIEVAAGDRGDRVVNLTGFPIWIRGGKGNDVLIGGPGEDSLTGGSGADVIRGKIGDDSLNARDGVSDTVIDCDDGLDRADLDPLPKDPGSVITDCEIKTRN
jgi:DNA-binding beta-propeller fold protein YncE